MPWSDGKGEGTSEQGQRDVVLKAESSSSSSNEGMGWLLHWPKSWPWIPITVAPHSLTSACETAGDLFASVYTPYKMSFSETYFITYRKDTDCGPAEALIFVTVRTWACNSWRAIVSAWFTIHSYTQERRKLGPHLLLFYMLFPLVWGAFKLARTWKRSQETSVHWCQETVYWWHSRASSGFVCHSVRQWSVPLKGGK